MLRFIFLKLFKNRNFLSGLILIFLSFSILQPIIVQADTFASSGYEAGQDGILLFTEKCPADSSGELRLAFSRKNGKSLDGCYVINNRGNAIVKWNSGDIQELNWEIFGNKKLEIFLRPGRSNNFSPWEYFESKTTAGTPVCGISSASKDKSNVRNISIKHLANQDIISITLYDRNWNYKQADSVSVAIDFLDNQPLNLSAYADENIVDSHIPKELTAAFLLVMKDSKVIRFKVAQEQNADITWKLPLKNMAPLISKFISCALTMKAK